MPQFMKFVVFLLPPAVFFFIDVGTDHTIVSCAVMNKSIERKEGRLSFPHLCISINLPGLDEMKSHPIYSVVSSHTNTLLKENTILIQ